MQVGDAVVLRIPSKNSPAEHMAQCMARTTWRWSPMSSYVPVGHATHDGVVAGVQLPTMCSLTSQYCVQLSQVERLWNVAVWNVPVGQVVALGSGAGRANARNELAHATGLQTRHARRLAGTVLILPQRACRA